VADASPIGPSDQERGVARQGLRPIDHMLRCQGNASRRDLVRVAPVGRSVFAQQQFEPSLDLDRLSDMFAVLARKHQVPGAQLAIHHGGQTVAIEVGELEYGTGHRVTPDAAFPIGSISKTFTATLAMILVADGDLELDAPLGEHVPELGKLGNELTLRQVLSHTGGLAAGPDSEQVLTASLRRYVLDHCRSQNLVLPPATGFSYSNIGYALVGHLIETITGMSWWQAIESILLWPLGIEPTFICGAERRPLGRPLATGHSVNTAVRRIRPVEQSFAPAEAPAGGLAVSAVDLLTLGLTHLDGRTPALLPLTYAEQMRQAVPGAEPFGLADGWGLGLAVFRSGNTTWVGHDGNANGTACYLRFAPAYGCAIAFTSNGNIGFGMWHELVTKLRGVGLPICNYSTVETSGRPTVPPSGCVGTYVNGDTEYSVTAQKNGDYYLAVDGEAVSRLTFYDSLIFSQQDLDSGEWVHAGRLLRDPITGEIYGIQVAGRLARRQFATSKNLMSVGARDRARVVNIPCPR
jgi:CubicO group peptidase (beta-lactamase class C family)